MNITPENRKKQEELAQEYYRSSKYDHLWFSFFLFFFRRPRPIPGIASSSKLAEKEKDERMSAGRRRTTNQRTASLRTEGNRSSLNGSSDEESETDSRVNEDDEEDDNDSEPPRVSYFKYFYKNSGHNDEISKNIVLGPGIHRPEPVAQVPREISGGP